MVVPLFGWSVGDVISAARALYKIGQAFSETQGAATQYAEASKVLEYLAKDRQRAQELIESRPTSKYTSDVRAKLEIVDAAYGAFEQHQEDYRELEPGLLATGTKRRDLLRKQSKKIKWAVERMNGKLQILKDAVAEPLGCMNASYLHLTLDEIAAIRQATAQQKNDVHNLELSLGLGFAQQRKELVSTGATLAHLLTRLDDQQLDLTTQLMALQTALERIEEQTKPITTSQTLAQTNSNSTSDKEYQSTLIQIDIQKNTNKLWDELMRSHEAQKGTSESILEIMKKLSQLEKDLGLLEVRGRRVETFAMVSACSAIALLAMNILTVLRVRSVDNALQDVLAGPVSYHSNRPISVASRMTAKYLRLRSASADERHAVMGDAWTRANPVAATAAVNMIEAPLVACDETSPITSGGNALAPHAPFYIIWKPLIPLPQHTERPKCYRRTSLCSPPVIKEAFRPQNSRPVVYKWTPGSLDPAPLQDLEYLEEYKTSSVFWRPDHQTYLTVPYDCMTNSVVDKARDDPLNHWERLKFNHEAINGRCVSVVGHCNGNDVLAATGPENWLGELIPPAHQRHDEPAVPNTEGTSYLAGDISIIIALAALSTSLDLVRWTIANSFRPPNHSTWVPHGQKQMDRAAEHGIIVQILVDNRFPGFRTHLDAWDVGRARAVLS